MLVEYFMMATFPVSLKGNKMSSCLYGSRVRDKRYNISILLVSGALLATAFQYLPFYFHEYSSLKESVYWALSQDQFSDAGFVRYVKDGYLLLFGIAWPPLCYVWAESTTRKKLFRWIGILLSIISFGLIGAISNPLVYMLLAGLRWVLLLHSAVGIWFVLRCSYGASMEWARSIGKILLLVLLVSIFAGIINYLLSGGIWRPGIRVTSIYASAPVFAEMMVAIAMFSFVSSTHRVWIMNIILYSLTFFGAALAGSRSSMVVIGLIWIASILQGFRGKEFRINPILFILLLSVFAILAVNVSSQLASRGNLYDNFSGKQDTRLYYFVTAITNMSDKDFVTSLIGEGLGYGTNSYSILQGGMKQDVIHGSMDNTLIPFISQFGFVGGCFFVFFATLFLLFLTKTYRTSGIVIAMSLIILAITQNIFEMYPIMLIIPMVMLLLEQRKKERIRQMQIKRLVA